jgi:hypothetical protein
MRAGTDLYSFLQGLSLLDGFPLPLVLVCCGSLDIKDADISPKRWDPAHYGCSSNYN